jgi:hypothetical protein
MQTYCYLINFDRIISNYHIWWYASMPEVIEHASWNLLMCSLATCAILHHVAIYIIVYIDIDIDIDIYNLIYIYYHTHSIYIYMLSPFDQWHMQGILQLASSGAMFQPRERQFYGTGWLGNGGKRIGLGWDLASIGTLDVPWCAWFFYWTSRLSGTFGCDFSMLWLWFDQLYFKKSYIHFDA